MLRVLDDWFEMIRKARSLIEAVLGISGFVMKDYGQQVQLLKACRSPG
jgi:hypothetical protein